MRDRLGGAFWWTWTASTVSAVGTEVSLLALPLTAVVVLGASAAEMGVLRAAAMAPGVALGLIAGALVDRSAPRRVLLTANLVLALVLVSVPAAHAVSMLSFGQLLAVAAATSVAATFVHAGMTVFVSRLVPPDELARANARLHLGWTAATTSGRALGGVLVKLLTAPVAVLVDAASYVVASACLLRAGDVASAASTAARVPLRASIAEGLAIVRRAPVLRSLAIVGVLWSFPGQMAVALYVLFIVELTGDQAPLVLGAVGLSGGIGMMLGSVCVAQLAGRVPVGTLVAGGVLLNVASIFCIPLARGSVAAVTAWLVVGAAVGPFGFSAYGVGTTTLVQQAAPREALGRAFSVMGVAGGVAGLTGALVGGVLGDRIGVRDALWVAAVLHLPMLVWLARTPLRRGAEREVPGHA